MICMMVLIYTIQVWKVVTSNKGIKQRLTNERFYRSDNTKDKDITDVALKEKDQFDVSMTKLTNTKQN